MRDLKRGAAYVLLWLWSASAFSAINISIGEFGGDVVVSASGSFDTSNCISTGVGSALALLEFDGTDIEVIAGAGASTTFCTLSFSSAPSGLFPQTSTKRAWGPVTV
jgi:hypothetical protein